MYAKSMQRRTQYSVDKTSKLLVESTNSLPLLS